MSQGDQRPRGGGGRFDLTVREGLPATVVKRGSPAALAREARGLRLVAGLGLAPRLIRSGPGVLVTELVPGASRPFGRLDPADARTLGRLLRRLHDSRRTATGGLPGWSSRARTLAGYRRRRATDALALAGPRDRGLAGRVVRAMDDLPAGRSVAPFRLLHGDLVASNVVWGGGPMLVDWEFWRMGDPAEDLAYLAEVNALPELLLAEVLAGYDRTGMPARVTAWRALSALDAALWYRGEGQEGEAERLIARALSAARTGGPAGPRADEAAR